MSKPYVAAEHLRLLVERVERLTEEKKGIADDIKDVFGEAKSHGFDVPTLKTVIKLRKLEPADRNHQLSMVEVYLTTLGLSDGSLSEMAAAFLEERRAARAPRATGDASLRAGAADPAEAPAFTAEALAAFSTDDAARLGRDAQAMGCSVRANPFPAGVDDFRAQRAAWDEAWLASAAGPKNGVPDWLLGDDALAKRLKDEEAAREAEAEAARTDEEKRAAAGEVAETHLEAARRLVISHQDGSTAKLQQALGIPYPAAAMIMETLQAEGVVSGTDLQGRREVLKARETLDADAE